jgi:ubiquinone/menaquinone biosynthesis C-methylase UbiE
MENLQLIVKEKYGQIARQSSSFASCCSGDCGCSQPANESLTIDYRGMEGYNPEADLGLGCGLPTRHAHIRAGDFVLDLGSGAGNDCFVALSLTGETGHVTGLDFTAEMIEKARKNAAKTGYSNIDFILGDIEEMPLPDNRFDVVISNCVLNLVPAKTKAFAEIFRVLKPGGHMSVSDIVLQGELPEKIRKEAEMYAGCVSGAIQRDEYLQVIGEAGLVNMQIRQETRVDLSDEILLKYLDQSEIDTYRQTGSGIFSITLYAEKPGK